MILLHLEGGLGNQLFQYSLGKHLSLIHKTPLVFDIESYKTNPIADCSYWLEDFGIDIRNNLVTPDVLERYKSYRSKKGRRNILHNLLHAKPERYVEEKHYWFDPSIVRTKPPFMLHGWWQSEQYFKDIRSTLLNDLSYAHPLSHKRTKIIEHMRATESVSIHVRRMDYVKNPKTRSAHGELPISYYRTAHDHLYSKRAALNFFVFSDDIEWVKKNMKFPDGTTYIGPSPDDTTGAADMWMMSKCRHQVLANSSFSWWGAWLNQNPDKIVIGPKPWVASMGVEQTRDVLPKDWITLPVDYIRS